MKRANRELLALYDINRLLQTQLPTEEKLYIILTSLTADDAFGYSRAYLLLMNDQNHTLEGWLGVGPLKGDEAREIWEGVTALEEEDTAPGRKNISELLERAPFDIKVRSFVVPVSRGQGHPVQTVISRRPKLLRDIKSGKEPLHPEFEKILSSEQVAFIPMLSKKHVMGVIAVESPGGDRSIDEKRLRTLTVFGNLAAIALENSKLYHDLEEKVSTLERVNRELQDAQAKIMQLDRLASMGAIAAGVAHEIKNPLNSLFINMHLLKEEVLKTQPEVRKLLEVVEMETERLSSTVIEFLNYSKLPKPCLVPSQPHRVLDSVLDMIDEKRLRTLTVFGNLAAIALENSKLYHDLEEKVSTLERVNRRLQDAQAKIMQLDRLASMGAIAAGVAHEIKNPLNSLFINLHLL